MFEAVLFFFGLWFFLATIFREKRKTEIKEWEPRTKTVHSDSETVCYDFVRKEWSDYKI